MRTPTPDRAWTLRGTLRWVLPLALLAGAAAPLHAQPSVAEATDAQKEHAREAYARGKTAFEAGDFDAALAAFRQADGHVTSPNAQLMVGRSLLALQRRVEARAVFAGVVRGASQFERERYGETVDAAQQALDSLDAQLAHVSVELDDPAVAATLRVAGREIAAERWGEAIATEPGTVEVLLEAEDGRRAHSTLELAAGARASVRLSLTAQPPPVVSAAPTSAAEPSGERPSGSGSGMRLAGYALGGAGLAGLGAFAVLGAMSASKADTLERECPERVACAPQLRDTADEGAALQTAANVSLVAGGVLLGVGVTLLVLADDGGDSELVVTATPGGVRLRGQF